MCLEPKARKSNAVQSKNLGPRRSPICTAKEHSHTSTSMRGEIRCPVGVSGTCFGGCPLLVAASRASRSLVCDPLFRARSTRDLLNRRGVCILILGHSTRCLNSCASRARPLSGGSLSLRHPRGVWHITVVTILGSRSERGWT